MDKRAADSQLLSDWMAALLSGRKPNSSQDLAFRALAKTNPASAEKMLRGVAEAVGGGDAQAGMRKIMVGLAPGQSDDEKACADKRAGEAAGEMEARPGHNGLAVIRKLIDAVHRPAGPASQSVSR